jgi:hypothetical protein
VLAREGLVLGEAEPGPVRAAPTEVLGPLPDFCRLRRRVSRRTPAASASAITWRTSRERNERIPGRSADRHTPGERPAVERAEPRSSRTWKATVEKGTCASSRGGAPGIADPAPHRELAGHQTAAPVTAFRQTAPSWTITAPTVVSM